MTGRTTASSKPAKARFRMPDSWRMRVFSLAECQRRAAGAADGVIWASQMGAFPEAAGHYVARAGGLDPYVMFCHAGSGWAENRGERRRVQAGEAAFIDCSRPHRYGADGHDPWSTVWVHLGGPGAEAWRRRLTLDGRRWVWPVHRPNRVLPAFEEAWECLEAGDHLAASTALAHWLALLVARARAEADQDDGVLRVAQALRDDPQLDPSLAEMATWAGLSPSRFLAKFRTRWGLAPRAYLNRQRVQRACWLLDTTDLKMEAIAQACGLGSAFYFTRVFGRVMGMPPSAYRRRPRS